MNAGKCSSVLFLLLGLMLFFMVPAAVSKTLKMGCFIVPPHHINQSDPDAGPRGAAIEYFNLIAQKAGFQVHWESLPLLRLTEYLRNGKIDGTVSFPKFPLFEAFLYYAKKPMFFGQPIFALRKDSPVSTIRSIEDIKGFHIGVAYSKTDLYTPVIDENRDKIFLEKRPDLNWVELNILQLMNNRLDALFDRQQYAIPYVARKMKLQDKIKIINASAPATPFYVVFSKALDQNKSVLAMINQVIQNQNPDYEKLLDKQFKLLD